MVITFYLSSQIITMILKKVWQLVNK